MDSYDESWPIKMEFTFETTYHQKAAVTMSEVLRKTVRRKRSQWGHVFVWIAIASVLLITLPSGKKVLSIDIKTVIIWVAGLIYLGLLLFEDNINGYIARRRMRAGTDQSTTVFQDGKFITTIGIGRTEFFYNKINMPAETDGFFVLVLGKSHAQVYDKSKLSGGTVEEFRKFIAEKTGKAFEKVKSQ